MNTNALISVIVPVYNAAEHLPACVKALTAQTVFDRMEILLIDDGSSDGSGTLCDEVAARHPNITAVHQANAGVSIARNTGLLAATGTYIGFADADDTVEETLFETLAERGDTTGADLCFCGFVEELPVGENTILYPFSRDCVLNKDEIYAAVVPFMLEFDTFNTCCAKLYRRELIERHRIRFEPGIRLGEDRLFVGRYLLACETAVYCSLPLYRYRYSPTGAVHRARTAYADEAAAQYRRDYTLFALADIPEVVIRDKAGRRLLRRAVGDFWTANDCLRGKTRVKALRRFVNNEEIRQQVRAQSKAAKDAFSRYERVMLRLLAMKSVTGMRAVIGAVRIKTKLRAAAARFFGNNKGKENA